MSSDAANRSQGRQNNFDNIPEEMRAFRQWVTWKFEQDDGDQKPTKVLYNPLYCGHASVAKPETWVSFEEVKDAYENSGEMWAGIGFVLTSHDPYCFIDLDDTTGRTDHDELFARQNELYNSLESYAEWSPSGKGLHIITKGAVERGRKRAQIEIYSQLRFMTMTGNVYRNAPIVDEDTTVKMWWHAMGGRSTSATATHNHPQTVEDDVIRERMFKAKSGAKTRDLYDGKWQQYHGSWSEADQALFNVIAFFTKNREQVVRIFQSSQLAKRQKAFRADYVERTLDLAFDRDLPAVNIDVVLSKLGDIVERAKITPQGTQGAAPDGLLPVVRGSDLAGKDIMPRLWHVADLVPARTVTLLSGDGGTGKSLAALQLAVATVIGGRWTNAMVRQGGAYFLTAEDEIDEVHRRLADIARSEGIGLDSLGALTVSSLAGQDALLAVPVAGRGVLAPTVLFEAVRDHIEAMRPALTIFDTSADLYGGEEMNRAQVRQFIGYLRGLALHYDMAVLLLSHPSLTGMNSGSGLSGSTAWNNSVRSRLYLTQDKANPSMRLLQTMKANYGATGQEVRLQWRSGVFAVVGRTSNDETHRAVAEQTADGLFLHLLAKFTAQGRTVSAHPSSRTNAALLFAEEPEGKEFKRSGFDAAMKRLFDRRCIRIDHVGPPSKSKEIIVAEEGQGPSDPPSDRIPTPSDPGSNPGSDPRTDPFRPPAFSPPTPPIGQDGPVGAGPSPSSMWASG